MDVQGLETHILPHAQHAQMSFLSHKDQARSNSGHITAVGRRADIHAI